MNLHGIAAGPCSVAMCPSSTRGFVTFHSVEDKTAAEPRLSIGSFRSRLRGICAEAPRKGPVRPGTEVHRVQAPKDSAVLDDLGAPWIPGYRPARDYQGAVFEAIDRYLAGHPAVLDAPVAERPALPSAGDVFVTPPLAAANGPIPESLRQLVRKYDPVERDQACAEGPQLQGCLRSRHARPCWVKLPRRFSVRVRPARCRSNALYCAPNST